jgi:hypothetical protein
MNAHETEEEMGSEVAHEEVAEKPKKAKREGKILRGPWVVFKETFETWQNHWKVFTGIQIVWGAVFLATLIVGAIAAGFAIAVSGAFESVMTPQQMTVTFLAHPLLLAGLIIGGICAAAVLLITTTWMSLATVQAWRWVRHEEHFNMSVRNAYATTWEIVPNYLWISILAGILLVFGYIGFVIPGILLMFSFALLPSIAVMERLKGRHAIMRTTRLARPHLITIFVRVVLAGIVLYLPGQIGKAIFNSFSDGLGDALYQMYGLVVAPILTGVMFTTYLEAKEVERQEAKQSWLTLERVALIGALVAVTLITIIAFLNRG